MINHDQQLQTFGGSEENSRTEGRQAEKHMPSTNWKWRRQPLHLDWKAGCAGVSPCRGGVPFSCFLLISQMASGGTLAGGNTMFSSCLQLTIQTCKKTKKKKHKKKHPKNSSSSTAPHRVSSQNAKCYHSTQADSVFQVREQSEVPFSTFSSTSLKMI